VSRARFTPVQPQPLPTALCVLPTGFFPTLLGKCAIPYTLCICGTQPYTRTSFGFCGFPPTQQTQPTHHPPPTWLSAFYCISVAPLFGRLSIIRCLWHWPKSEFPPLRPYYRVELLKFVWLCVPVMNS